MTGHLSQIELTFEKECQRHMMSVQSIKLLSMLHVIGQLDNSVLISLFCLKFEFYYQSSSPQEFEECRRVCTT